MNTVLEAITAAAISLTLADEAYVSLRDLDTGALALYPTVPEIFQDWKRHFKQESLTAQIIDTGAVVRVPDTKADDRINPELIETGIYSFVGVPIPGAVDNLGVLYVYSHKSIQRFDDWGAVTLLQTLAGQAGLAIANVQAFQQIELQAQQFATGS